MDNPSLSEQPKNFPDNAKTVWTFYNLSGQSKNCPDNPKTVRTIQKLSGQSQNCPNNPETVRTIQKLSGQSKNCLDNPKIVRTIQKLSRQSPNSRDDPKTFQAIQKTFRTIQFSRAFVAKSSKSRFTHFIRKVFAVKIMLSGKFLLFLSLVGRWRQETALVLHSIVWIFLDFYFSD